MSGDFQMLEDVLVKESYTEEKFYEVSEETAELGNISIQNTDVVRIEESVHVNWSGVSSCNHRSRIESEVQSALQKWVQRKMYEHRHWRWLRFGAKASTVSCSQRRDVWTSVKSCGCRSYIPFYIEFRKP